MRYYISGAMSNVQKEEYTRRFKAAEESLRCQGYKVSNPARWVWFLRFFPYKVALVFDLSMMCFCDRIYLLDGWTESNGASVEHRFACATGMIVEYER